MYGKLINEVLEYAPVNYKTDTGQLIVNFDKSETLMKQYGYKEVIDEKPTYTPFTQYLGVSGYTEDSDSITINYTVMERDITGQNSGSTLAERVAAIENQLNQLAEQAEILDEEVNE